MKTYLITYSAGSKVALADYMSRSLETELKMASSYWGRPMDNVWIIKTLIDRDVIINRMKVNLPTDSKILIIEVTNDWIAFNLPEEVIIWMQGGL